jgi:hypothetical protein
MSTRGSSTIKKDCSKRLLLKTKSLRTLPEKADFYKELVLIFDKNIPISICFAL